MQSDDTKTAKCCSWNVNGLRAICKKHGSLESVLKTLQSDVVCLQETKITKTELSSELALTDDWTGYSGVVTFCRRPWFIPLETYSSLGAFIRGHSLEDERLCDDWMGLSELDAEGRCLVTVHSHFVLFNIYAPALTNEITATDRFDFKTAWFQLLHYCVKSLTMKKRNVILMGDFNCCPHLIDHCNPDSEKDGFYQRSDRRALLQMLIERNGPCYDVFRLLYPSKKHAFTCWNQSTRARVNNYGTRIDLILVADGVGAQFHNCFIDAGIAADISGSDHAPIWAEWSVSKDELPQIERAPNTSSQFLFKGKQGTLDGFVVARTEENSMEVQPLKRIKRSEKVNGNKRKKLAQQQTLKSFFSAEKKEQRVDHSRDLATEIMSTPKTLNKAWQSFFDKKKPPLCSGHRKPCVIRVVKKSGANQGRRFYVCSLPEGPHPVGRCDHFQWET